MKFCPDEEKYFKNELKRILIGYTSWDSKTVRNLEKLGFDVETNHKHAILRIDYDNKKYTFAISKTPSDKRAGMNNVSIIYRTMFRY